MPPHWLRPLPGLEPVGIALWWQDLRDPLPFDVKAVLDPVERARMDRFHFDRDAVRYARARCGLRHLLSYATGLAPQQIELTVNEYGKPRLAAPGAPLNFNMSHSADFALFGLHFGEMPVGVDIELNTETLDTGMEQTAKGCFTNEEFATVFATPLESRRPKFLRCWTRKEACLKAAGFGLSLDPRSFEAGVGEQPREVTMPWLDRHIQLTVASLRLPEAIPCEAAVAWRIQP